MPQTTAPREPVLTAANMDHLIVEVSAMLDRAEPRLTCELAHALGLSEPVTVALCDLMWRKLMIDRSARGWRLVRGR